jgi:SAM-dependent methyltransferase
MSNLIDQQYLLNEEYKNASHLTTRTQFIDRFSINKVDQYRWIFDHFNLGPGSRILELGCGPAFLWQRNLDRLPSDWIITLSDFSPGMLQEAQHNLHDSDHNFTFLITDAQTIPLETARFDAVIANNMLYHVPDRQRALSEIYRVLKPDGYLYASTMGETSFCEIKTLMEQYNILSPLWREPLGFSLENGGEQLSLWFRHVDLHHLENPLLVTETEPLIQMICTGGLGELNMSEMDLQRVRKKIDQELIEHGSFHITIHFGLFVAHGQK